MPYSNAPLLSCCHRLFVVVVWRGIHSTETYPILERVESVCEVIEHCPHLLKLVTPRTYIYGVRACVYGHVCVVSVHVMRVHIWGVFMCVHMCVCGGVFMCVHMCVWGGGVRGCSCVYIHVCVCMWVFMYICVCVCVCVHVCKCVCSASVYIRMCVFMCGECVCGASVYVCVCGCGMCATLQMTHRWWIMPECKHKM